MEKKGSKRQQNGERIKGKEKLLWQLGGWKAEGCPLGSVKLRREGKREARRRGEGKRSGGQLAEAGEEIDTGRRETDGHSEKKIRGFTPFLSVKSFQTSILFLF
ncbi:hypothetical protein ACFX1Q_000020 [Malus domestica]